MLLESEHSKKYKSAHKRFIKPLLERFFEVEFPKMFGPNMRSAIANKILEIINNNFKSTEYIKAGQILWNAVHKDTRADSYKMKLVPVILTMLNDEDITKLENGTSLTIHRQNVIARITKEAYKQGALLSMRDISIMMAISGNIISKSRIEYEKRNQETLPHTGNLHDMGSCITHKYQIIYKYVVEKKDPIIISKETNHTIYAVDHYLKDFNRVKTLYLDKKEPEYIHFTTNISLQVVNQYIDIIKQYVKEL